MGDEAIKRYAERLRLGVFVVFALLLVLVAFGHFGMRIAGAPVLLQSRTPNFAGNFGMGDGILLLLAVAVYWLTEGLRAVAGGAIFSRTVVRSFRMFALWMLIVAVFSAVAPTLLATSRLATAHHHRLMIMIDVRDLLLVAITLLLLLISHMFERARALDDEMREIV